MTDLFGELKRRNVFRVAVVYIVVAWLLLQVADILLDNFGVPEWGFRFITVLLIIGFPIALIFAWAFEITPEGIKKEKDVDRSQSITSQTGRKLDFTVIGLLVIALGYFMYQHFLVDDEGSGSSEVVAVDDKSIAVLPFLNMSEDASNAFFAGGVHEDILTYLSKVRDLRVISRSSVMKYADKTNIDLRQVGEDLGVAHILEGSVRRAGNQVRVTAQLISTDSDEHIWAENYDAELDNVFEIQTSIAKEIVAALQANLSPAEAEALADQPTQNIDAYDLYLKARVESQSTEYTAEKYFRVEALLEQVLELDPDFTRAWLLLADTHGQIIWLGADNTPERLEKMKAAIDRAFELDPDSPEARSTLGIYYYRGFSDYEAALAELEIAHEGLPNSAEILDNLGLAQRRLGFWEESINSFERALKLEPDKMDLLREYIGMLAALRQFDKALEKIDQAIAGHPDEDVFRIMKANFLVMSSGDASEARALWRNVSADSTNEYSYLCSLIRGTDGNDADVLECLDRIEAADPSTKVWLPYIKSQYLLPMGQEEEAQRLLDDVVVSLEGREITGNSPRAFYTALHGNVESLRGNGDRGVELVREGIDIIAHDPVDMGGYHGFLAQALAYAGRYDEAIEVLAENLQAPFGHTCWTVQFDPAFDALKDDPAFQALIESDPLCKKR